MRETKNLVTFDRRFKLLDRRLAEARRKMKAIPKNKNRELRALWKVIIETFEVELEEIDVLAALRIGELTNARKVVIRKMKETARTRFS